MSNYERVCVLAAQLGFTDFTGLQKKIFTDERFYDLSKWLFILGATSSGKTLVALIAYFLERENRARKNLPYKMLFAVPYRALAAQKTSELTEAVEALGLSLRICQSTSEYIADDERIFRGDADIVIIINEKIFMFAGMDADFLGRYDLLVLDEISLVKESLRGIKTDFILLHARRRKNLRVVALGTPFFAWNNYVAQFNFVLFTEEARPIKIIECPVTYDDEKLCAVAEGCRAVSPMKFSESDFFRERLENNSKSEPKGETHLLIMIAEICRFHLQRGERILLFINHREDVRKFSQVLSCELARRQILVPTMSSTDCKAYIREKIQADGDDILCGIMDEADYFAFACGVSYHNANMFSALRALIEEDFLSENGRLKIIFSTETLAYGINSNADVVIIPRMAKIKYDNIKNAVNSGRKEERFLYPNEYMNYCGRAGRLTVRRALSEQKSVGWVYPFICANRLKKDREINSWRVLREQIHSPDMIASKFFETNAAEYRPLCLLSLFSLFAENRDGITAEQIETLIRNLPGCPAGDELSAEAVKVPIAELLERNLIYKVEDDFADDDLTDEEPAHFKPSDVGKNLAGFVISLTNYDRLLSGVGDYVTAKNFFVVDMFASIVSSSEVTSAAKMNLGELKFNPRNNKKFLRNTVLQMRILFLRFERQTTPALRRRLMDSVAKFERLLEMRQFNDIYPDADFKIYRVLAATLLWYDAKICTPTRMYNNFRIYYETMHRIVEIVSYRIDIISRALPLAASPSGDKLRSVVGAERLREVADRMKSIVDDFVYFPSQELCDFLGIKHCDFYKAQHLREVERLYKLLRAPARERKSRRDEISRLAAGMRNWHEPWRTIFLRHFGGELRDRKL